MKKRCVTLLELMISLALLSALITSLLFWYGHLTQQKITFSRLTTPLLKKHYAYTRLEHVINQQAYLKEPIFFTSQEPDGSTSLVFSFHNGLHPHPELSGPVLAKLSCYDHKLLLTLWPYPQTPATLPTFQETVILLDHVEQLDVSFLAHKGPEFLPVSPEEVGISKIPHPGWHTAWSYSRCPALVRLKIAWETPLTWTFDLHPSILYPAEAL